MDNNISGNVNTTDEEIKVVIDWMEKMISPYKIQSIVHNSEKDIYKYNDANAGDVMVRFKNSVFSLFEVKQESYERFKQYGEYGIDFISCLVFAQGVDPDKWKGVQKPEKIDEFIKDLDPFSSNFKWGKIAYSYADVWLFYVKNPNTGEYEVLEAYCGRKMQGIDFYSYMKRNCVFTVNNKPADQMSHSDTWASATFFVNPKVMEPMKITPYNFEQSVTHNNFNNKDIKNKNAQPPEPSEQPSD